MAAGDLITLDYQFEYATTFLFGRSTVVPLIKMPVGLGLPDLRTSDLVRPRDHGMLPGFDWMSARVLEFDVQPFASSYAALKAQIDALAAAGASTLGQLAETTLVWQMGGVKRRVNCKLRRVAFPFDADVPFGKAAVVLQFLATDPRIYDNALTTVGLTLPVASGGLGFPFAWPVGWGSSTSGLGTAINAGTISTYPVVTFTGPLTGLTISNVTTGQSWISTFNLLAGDTMVVDFGARTSLLNGTSSRYSFITSASVWWALQPGSNSLQMGSSAGSGTASVAFRSAWLLG